MNEVIIAALISAAATIGSSLLKRKSEQQQPVVINVPQVREQDTPLVRPVAQPNVYAPDHYIIAETEPIQFDVTFEPVDDETFEYLDATQPVIIFIFDPNDLEEMIFFITDLGQGINNGELYPGQYGLLALVYVDEELEYIDAIGVTDFTIEEYELPFDLRVPISSDENMIAGLLGTETTIIGNRKSHIYHFPHCPGVYQMAAGNRVIFPSQEAAEDDGYEPCTQCVGDEYGY